MALIRGKDVLVFVTTETTASAIVLTGSTPEHSASSTGIGSAAPGIGALGSVDAPEDTGHAFPLVEGVEVSKGWESENVTFVGMKKEYVIPHRKNWEITLTLRAQNKALSVLSEGARFGAQSGAIASGLTEYTDEIGYRLYVYNGSSWDIFYHGFVPDDGYKETYDSSKTTVASIKFVGNQWSTSRTQATELTASCPLE